jgi:hypothetical protein
LALLLNILDGIQEGILSKKISLKNLNRLYLQSI